MKNTFVFLFVMFSYAVIYASDKNVNIHIDFTNEVPEYVSFMIDPGFSLDFRHKKCEIDSTGIFDFNIEFSHSNLVWLASNKYMCWLIVSPGDSIKVTFLGGFYELPFDNNAQSSTIIEGDNMAGNVALNRLKKEKYCYSDTKLEIDSINPYNITNISQRVYDKELRVFSDLLSVKDIDSTYYNTITTFLGYMNASILTATIISYIADSHISNKEKSKLLEIVEQSYADFPLSNKLVMLMGNGIHKYFSDYLDYLEIAFQEDYKRHSNAGTINTYEYKLLNEAANETTFELIGIEFLWSRTFFGGGKEELELYQSYLSDYPDTKYSYRLEELEKNIENIKRIISNEKKKLPSNIHVIENHEKINTLDSLLSIFMGSFVYVDIWATWCGPCLGEHRKSGELEKYAKDTEIVLLYISTDGKKSTIKWMNYLKEYDLQGFHILANENLIEDIKREIPDFIGIPWYFIVNKEGKIVNYDAKRPSSGDLLFEQLNRTIRQ